MILDNGTNKGARATPARSGDEPAPGSIVIRREGGRIPHLDGVAAFELSGPEPSEIPILIAVPHGGRIYPPYVVERMRNPAAAALRLEDRLVDLLGTAVAEATGAGLLVARAPRAMIDLNRAADDVDWDMLDAPARAHGAPGEPRHGTIRRAKSGLGLIPRRVPGTGELWKHRLDPADLEARLSGVHAPYHAALGEALAQLRQRWGAALLLDLHSMPPLDARHGAAAPSFVLGDRFGATCAGSLIASVFGWFGRHGELAAHNRPYAGGYALERHAAPRDNIHAFQLEIDRARYLDSRLVEQGPGFDRVVDLVVGLVRELAGQVAELGRSDRPREWAQAAE